MDIMEVPEYIDDILVSRVRRTSEYVMVEPHEHPFYEIYYLISGSSRMFLGQALYSLAPGHIVAIRPGEIHRIQYEDGAEAERYGIYFTREYVRGLEASCGHASFRRIFASPGRSLPPPLRQEAEGLFGRMMAEAGRRDDFAAIQTKCALYQLLILMGRCPEQPREQEQLEASEQAVLEAARYLFDHHRESVTLEQAAGIAHMSPTYFSKKFKQATGFGFKEYLNSLRIQDAAAMLRNTDMTVTEIALACGFSDGNYFGDAFKKARGVSPREFRRVYCDD